MIDFTFAKRTLGENWLPLSGLLDREALSSIAALRDSQKCLVSDFVPLEKGAFHNSLKHSALRRRKSYLLVRHGVKHLRVSSLRLYIFAAPEGLQRRFWPVSWTEMQMGSRMGVHRLEWVLVGSHISGKGGSAQPHTGDHPVNLAGLARLRRSRRRFLRGSDLSGSLCPTPGWLWLPTVQRACTGFAGRSDGAQKSTCILTSFPGHPGHP